MKVIHANVVELSQRGISGLNVTPVIFKAINRKELAKGNAPVSFELIVEMDDGSELIVKRSWNAGANERPRPKDLTERLVVVRDGKRVSVQNKQMWQDFIRSTIPQGNKMNLKWKRIMNGNAWQPRVCFCHSESIFFGKYCSYCDWKTATYGAFFVYPWQPFTITKYLLKTLFKRLRVATSNN